MRKFQIVGLTLAVFAFSAVAVSSASAASKILYNGTEITALLNIEIVGSLLLEDAAATGKPDVLCTGVFDGMIEPGSTLIFIEALLSETGGAAGNLVECVDDNGICSSPVDVTALNLPWDVTIELDLEPALNIYLAEFKEEAGKTPSYAVDCNSLIGLVEDTCTGLSSARLVNTAAGLLGYFNALLDSETWGAESEALTCTQGGAGQALIVSVILGTGEDTEASGALIKDSETGATGLLSVSE